MAEHPNAFCKACNVEFKTSNSGVLQVKSHAKGVKHQDKERVRCEKTNHRVFVISSESEELTLSTSKTNLVHTNEDKLIKVETIQALDFIQSNYSFASAANDSEEYRIMFPDTKIAKSYSQGETKVKYVIQFGIALCIKELILDHIKRKLSLSYLTRLPHSKSRSSLMLTCNTVHLKIKFQILFGHFHYFIKELGLNPNLLHLGMDGPNINLKFQQDLSKYFDEKHVLFLNTDTSSA